MFQREQLLYLLKKGLFLYFENSFFRDEFLLLKTYFYKI